MKNNCDWVFYRTNAEVQKGDEFYQIVLEQFFNLNEKCFRVEVFHGLAGTPPKEPESAYIFDTEGEAQIKISQTVSEIEGQNFRRHSPTLHGVKDFES